MGKKEYKEAIKKDLTEFMLKALDAADKHNKNLARSSCSSAVNNFDYRALDQEINRQRSEYYFFLREFFDIYLIDEKAMGILHDESFKEINLFVKNNIALYLDHLKSEITRNTLLIYDLIRITAATKEFTWDKN